MSIVRFMLLMPWGRVGSNLMLSALRQSAQMKLENENLIVLPDAAGQSAWFHAFYETASNPQWTKYIGCKQNFLSFADPAQMKALMAEHGVKVVRMRRDDLVKAAVSQMRGEQYAKWSEKKYGEILWSPRSHTEIMGPTEIDPTVLLGRIATMGDAHARLMASFAPGEVFDVEYEEINRNLNDVVHRVRDYIGVPQKPFELRFRKMTPDNLEDAIVNLSEVRAALMGAPHRIE